MQGEYYQNIRTGEKVKVLAVCKSRIFVNPNSISKMPFIIGEHELNTDYNKIELYNIKNLVEFLFQFRG